MHRKTIASISLTLFAVHFAEGFSVDTSYAGGFQAAANSPYGDSLQLKAPPASELPTTSAASACMSALAGFGYHVSQGAGIDGTMSIDIYKAETRYESGPDDYFLGYQIDARLTSPETFSISDKFVLYYREHLNASTYTGFISSGNGPFLLGDPFDEAGATNGSDQFGSFGKRFSTDTVSRIGDTYNGGPIDLDAYAFLVHVAGNNLTLREGLHFGFTGQQAAVPEPASALVIASGAFLMRTRRRMRK